MLQVLQSANRLQFHFQVDQVRAHPHVRMSECGLRTVAACGLWLVACFHGAVSPLPSAGRRSGISPPPSSLPGHGVARRRRRVTSGSVNIDDDDDVNNLFDIDRAARRFPHWPLAGVVKRAGRAFRGGGGSGRQPARRHRRCRPRYRNSRDTSRSGDQRQNIVHERLSRPRHSV